MILIIDSAGFGHIPISKLYVLINGAIFIIERNSKLSFYEQYFYCALLIMIIECAPLRHISELSF